MSEPRSSPLADRLWGEQQRADAAKDKARRKAWDVDVEPARMSSRDLPADDRTVRARRIDTVDTFLDVLFELRAESLKGPASPGASLTYAQTLGGDAIGGDDARLWAASQVPLPGELADLLEKLEAIWGQCTKLERVCITLQRDGLTRSAIVARLEADHIRLTERQVKRYLESGRERIEERLRVGL